MDDGEGFFVFLFGFVLGAFILAVLVDNHLPNSVKEINACEAVCVKSNSKLMNSYLDGDCECENGAFFDWDIIKSKGD